VTLKCGALEKHWLIYLHTLWRRGTRATRCITPIVPYTNMAACQCYKLTTVVPKLHDWSLNVEFLHCVPSSHACWMPCVCFWPGLGPSVWPNLSSIRSQNGNWRFIIMDSSVSCSGVRDLYLSPARASTNRVSYYLSLLTAIHRTSLHFQFPVPLSIGGWVGLSRW